MIRRHKAPSKLEYTIISWLLIIEFFLLAGMFGMVGAIVWHGLT